MSIGEGSKLALMARVVRSAQVIVSAANGTERKHRLTF